MVRTAASPPDGASPDENPRRGVAALRWLVLTVAVLGAIIIPFVLFETEIQTWTSAALSAVRGQPWLGGALIVGLLTGDVVLPVPSSVVSTFAGVAFGWKLGALVIWTGMTAGCAVGYVLGRSAGRVLAMRVVGEYELSRAQRLFDEVGPLALIVTRAVPVLAEAGALASGAARMPFLSFMAATSLANLGVAIAYAGVGAIAASTGSFLFVFLGLASIPALAWAAWRISRARAAHRAGQPKT